jgi:peptide/nickel transport system permease protein
LRSPFLHARPRSGTLTHDDKKKKGMRDYIIRRVLLIIPTLFLASLIVFFIIRLIPGNVVDLIAGQMAQFGKPVDRAGVQRSLGLDVPIYVQYGRWIGNILLHGDFGQSLWRNTSVAKEVMSRWPVTLELGLLGLIISLIISLPIGIFSAIRQDTWGDYAARTIAIILMAVPGFWIATMVVVFPSIWWGWSPPLMLIPFKKDPIGNLKMFIIPALVVGMEIAGVVMRMTRSMMLEVLRQDYIRTAWAKGLRERSVVMRHALKNSLIPVVILIGLQAPILIGGVVVIEQIFDLPGLGRLMIEAVSFRDYPLVMGIMLFFGVGMVIINLAVDMTYSFLDPRIKYK